jgi:hypothetical protein
MVSLWGSKKDDDPEPAGTQNGESSERIAEHQPPRLSEADERTRLLLPPTSGGYLSPDDPAVSAVAVHYCLLLLTQPTRYLHTTSGVYASCATSLFCFPLPPSSGGFYCWYPFSSARPECTLEGPGSLISPTPL